MWTKFLLKKVGKKEEKYCNKSKFNQPSTKGQSSKNLGLRIGSLVFFIGANGPTIFKIITDQPSTLNTTSTYYIYKFIYFQNI